MAYEAVDCVDAGTDYCPCYLAETNNCLICSQLQGKVFCDCINWKGVCIYQEYVWNGERSRDSRESLSAYIIEKSQINDNCLLMRIKVTRTLARELNQPGSYIFLRDEKCPEFFNVPMSVMCADESKGTIDILIQIRGVKTKVLKDVNESIIIRGPYWNGIMGLKNLKIVRNKNCLIIVRGIAQAPSVLVAKKLRFSGNNVFVILDGGRSQTTISKKYFESMGCSVIETNLLNGRALDDNGRRIIMDYIEKEDIHLVFSGGTDIIHKSILDIINSYSQNILFVCTNNSNICCGEGVCGSCSIRLKDGRRIKACKSQVDPIDIIGGI